MSEQHDKAIVEAAERLTKYGPHIEGTAPAMVVDANHYQGLLKAVAAKREAETPKLLTTDEALRLYYPNIADVSEYRSPINIRDMQRVLTACLERAALVVEHEYRELMNTRDEADVTAEILMRRIRRVLIEKE